MVQCPSWEANWFAASQEIPRISRNPKVHYRTHKIPPPVSILGQPNPVHIPTSLLLEIHPNIIHPSMPRSAQWSSSLRFPHQDPIHSVSSPILLLLLLAAIGLSPGGAGYFTCIQNMKLGTKKFKSGGLHEKHVVATWNVGNHLSICL